MHLIDAVPVLEVAITRVAVEVPLDLVITKVVLIIKSVVAVITLVLWLIRFGRLCPMACISHMLVDSVLTTKIPIARIAFKIGGAVTARVHMLLT